MRWTAEKIEEMRGMAEAKRTKKEAAAHFGAILRAIEKVAERHQFRFVKFSPAELLAMAEASRALTRARYARKDAKKRDARAAQVAAASAANPKPKSGGLSLPQKRMMYADNRDLTKKQMREIMRQAVLNTAALQVQP